VVIFAVDLQPQIDKDEVRETKLWDADTDCNRLTKRQYDVQLILNLNFNFPQVVWQHSLHVVGYIIWLLFRIFSSFQRWKNFKILVRCWQSYCHELGGPQCTERCMYCFSCSSSTSAASATDTTTVWRSAGRHVSEMPYSWNRSSAEFILCNDMSIDWLIDWLFDQLIDWLIDWSIDWLIDWLIDW